MKNKIDIKENKRKISVFWEIKRRKRQRKRAQTKRCVIENDLILLSADSACLQLLHISKAQSADWDWRKERNLRNERRRKKNGGLVCFPHTLDRQSEFFFPVFFIEKKGMGKNVFHFFQKVCSKICSNCVINFLSSSSWIDLQMMTLDIESLDERGAQYVRLLKMVKIHLNLCVGIEQYRS